MKTLFASLMILIMFPFSHYGQTAEEILDTYIENTGGQEAWDNLQAINIKGWVMEDNMKIPVDMYRTRNGKMAVIIELQGDVVPFAGFDGENYWEMNFYSMFPEKAAQETSDNMKLEANDFPYAMVNYRKNNYTVNYLGKETKEGAETYKVQLTQEPTTVNGVETPNDSYIYFETENYIPIVIETPQPNGQNLTNILSDYQEVEGLYFPYSFYSFGRKINVDEVILNPDIDSSMFEFPGED